MIKIFIATAIISVICTIIIKAYIDTVRDAARRRAAEKNRKRAISSLDKIEAEKIKKADTIKLDPVKALNARK